MELVIFIIVIVAVYFIFRSKKSNIKQYSDEELESMSFDEWKELNKQEMAEAKTSVLRIYLSQYEDLKKRIESGHKETVEGMTQQDKERSLESLNTVRRELMKRGVL